MFGDTLKNSNGIIPLINTEFNSHNKKSFKSNVINRSIKKALEAEFSNKDLIILYFEFLSSLFILTKI